MMNAVLSVKHQLRKEVSRKLKDLRSVASVYGDNQPQPLKVHLHVWMGHGSRRVYHAVLFGPVVELAEHGVVRAIGAVCNNYSDKRCEEGACSMVGRVLDYLAEKEQVNGGMCKT